MNIGKNDSSSNLNSIAMIMDGNGRWATRRGLPRESGHIAGAEAVGPIIRSVFERGIGYLTLYAFSSENWKRPAAEVSGIMELLYDHISKRAIPKLLSEQELSLKFIGDLSPLPKKLKEKCLEAEEISKGRRFVCSVALNYGGRGEIVRAANLAFSAGHTELTEDILSNYMYTSSCPDPDLIIRTGGEFRISNFLLWQSAYSEYIILDTLWPDITPSDIDTCIAVFKERQRRFGGLAT